jgi:Tfp pilus assembly protein PilN
MIRTNLSTRPFYNERAVRLWLLAIAIVVAAATVFNVSRVLHYSRNETDLALRASQDEAEANRLHMAAARERASVDAKQILAESARAKEANNLIDRRTFSWTALFNRFESTLPADVRITAVRPRLDEKDHRIELTVTVLSRTVDDVDRFMENLEQTGAFERLNPNDTRVDDTGQFETTLTMKYANPSAPEPAAAAEAGQARP